MDAQVDRFMGWLGTRDVASTICDVRQGAERHRDEVLARAQRMVEAGAPPSDALAYLANTLTNKLMHSPTVHIRRAGAEQRGEVVEVARAMFGTPGTARGGTRGDDQDG